MAVGSTAFLPIMISAHQHLWQWPAVLGLAWFSLPPLYRIVTHNADRDVHFVHKHHDDEDVQWQRATVTDAQHKQYRLHPEQLLEVERTFRFLQLGKPHYVEYYGWHFPALGLRRQLTRVDQQSTQQEKEELRLRWLDGNHPRQITFW